MFELLDRGLLRFDCGFQEDDVVEFGPVGTFLWNIVSGIGGYFLHER